MDEVSLAKHLVYVKDAEGCTRRIGETVINNTIIQHVPEFHSLDKVLGDIENFPIRQDDIWVLDFPKSGTHWILGIVEFLLSREVKDVTKSNSQGILELCHSLEMYETLPSPRVINSHMKLGMIPKRLLQDNKVIIMMRNPKSVAVSMYRHLRSLPYYDYSGTFSGYLPDFFKGHCPDLYGSWFDHVLEYWEAFKDKPNALFVFYEDLKKDPEKVIKHVSQFLELSHSASFIANVAKQTTLETMKTRQKKMAGGNDKLVEPFYRKGTIDDWNNQFTVAQNEMFDAIFEEKMKNYPDLKERIHFA